MRLRLLSLLLAAALAVAPGLSAAEEAPQIDLDLLNLSGTVVYSQIYNMLADSAAYQDKVVRVRGWFDYYKNAVSGEIYLFCVIPDAAACCSQGLEFVWPDAPEHVADFPEPGTNLIVTGRFESYYEDDFFNVRLADCAVEWLPDEEW